MPVICFGSIDLLIILSHFKRWDTTVLNSPPDLIRGQRLWVVVKYPLIWDLMLDPNTKL